MIARIILIGLMVLSLGMIFAKHGELKDGKYNGWISLITFIIEMTLLYYGGFFK